MKGFKTLFFVIFVVLIIVNLISFSEKIKTEQKLKLLKTEIEIEVEERQILSDSLFILNNSFLSLSDSLRFVSSVLKETQNSLRITKTTIDSLSEVNFGLLLNLFATERLISKQKKTISFLESLLVIGMKMDSVELNRKLDSFIKPKTPK